MKSSHAAPTDLRLDRDGVTIAARDYGGDGPDLLLVHGLGGSLDDWEPMVPHLSGFRLVSLDLRGHGRSDDGDWELEAVLADIAAVIEECGLVHPAILGHSLGGMLAAHWAVHHPCRGAISLDGHRSALTHPQNYHGMSTGQRDDDLAALAAMFEAQSAAMDDPLPEPVAASMSPRALAERDGFTCSRTTRETAETVRRFDWFLDCLPIIAEVEAPFLVVQATQGPHGTPERFEPLLAAYRAGLHTDLVDLSRRRTNVVTVAIDAGHGMVSQAPDKVAHLVTEFLE